MSFTSEVKDELSRVQPTCPRCDKAELAALIRLQGTLSISGGATRLEIATETASVARAILRLIKGTYTLRSELTVRRNILHKTHNYLITVPSQDELTSALHELGVLGANGFEAGIKEELVDRGCCAGAYLRGAFLANGYIADPRGDFHFELSASTEELAQGFVELMARCGIRARTIRRHNTSSVYIKGGDDILAFLAFVGAHASAIEVENARVLKSVRNDTNRRVNAEMANQMKTAGAAMRQIEHIRMLYKESRIETLPPALKEVAMLRLAHPDASLKELGELADPPLSKSAIAHRLQRLNAL